MFAGFLESMTGTVYAALRVAAGLMFAFHGMQKFGVMNEKVPEVLSQVWVGGLIELVTGLAVAAGILTRPAAFLASGTMLVAYVQFHWKFAFDANLLPAVNKGELALLYSGLFLYIACRGAGKWSLDGCRRKTATSA